MIVVIMMNIHRLNWLKMGNKKIFNSRFYSSSNPNESLCTAEDALKSMADLISEIHAYQNLAKLIKQIYHPLGTFFYPLNYFQVEVLARQIANGEYNLSPLTLYIDDEEEDLNCLCYQLPDGPSKVIINGETFFGYFIPDAEDQLVLSALGAELCMGSCKINDEFGYYWLNFTFHEYVQSLGKIQYPVSRIYRFKLLNVEESLNKERLVNRVKTILNTVLYNYVKTFIEGKYRYNGIEYIFDGLPDYPAISENLLNISVIDLDERFFRTIPAGLNFTSLTPAYSYVRYSSELLIATTDIDPEFEPKMKACLDAFNFDYSVEYIDRNGAMALFNYMSIHLNSKGLIEFESEFPGYI